MTENYSVTDIFVEYLEDELGDAEATLGMAYSLVEEVALLEARNIFEEIESDIRKTQMRGRMGKNRKENIREKYEEMANYINVYLGEELIEVGEKSPKELVDWYRLKSDFIESEGSFREASEKINETF